MSKEVLDTESAGQDTRAPTPVPAYPGRVDPHPGGRSAEDISSSTATSPRTRVAVLAAIRQWLSTHKQLIPRFVADPRPSLAERIDWSFRGTWTAERGGPKRTWMVIWTYTVWLFFAIVADLADLITGFLEWAARVPGRFAWVVVIFFTVATTLHDAPVIGWVLPRELSVLTWPPLSWIFGG